MLMFCQRAAATTKWAESLTKETRNLPINQQARDTKTQPPASYQPSFRLVYYTLPVAHNAAAEGWRAYQNTAPVDAKALMVLKPRAFVLGTAHLCFSHQILYKASPPDTPQPESHAMLAKTHKTPPALRAQNQVVSDGGGEGAERSWPDWTASFQSPKQPSHTDVEQWRHGWCPCGPSAVHEALGGKQMLHLVRLILTEMCSDASIARPCGSQHLGKVGVGAATLWLQRTGKCAAHICSRRCDFSPRRLRLLRTWRFMCTMPSQGEMTQRQKRRLCRQIFQPASLLGARLQQRARLHSYSVGIPRRACRRPRSWVSVVMIIQLFAGAPADKTLTPNRRSNNHPVLTFPGFSALFNN